MAARSRSRKNQNTGFLTTLLLALLLLSVGTVVGYCWRSYAPIALPFESKLVSDGSSSDLGEDDLRRVVRLANERADKAERDRDKAIAQLQALEDARQQTERELADLKIKSVLQSADD